MDKIELNIIGITNRATTSDSYALVIEEIDGNRNLPIIVGEAEAQSIAVALENKTVFRPLLHDVFKSFSGAFDVELKEIVINDYSKKVYFTKLIFESGNKTVELDSRTSDAIALAIRFNCPIYTYDFVLDKTGVVMEDKFSNGLIENSNTKPGDIKLIANNNNDLSGFSEIQLNNLLSLSVKKEDYERAALIKAELDNRF